MRHPMGRWAVLAVGVWIAGYGLWLLYRSVAKEPEKRLDVSRSSFPPAAKRIQGSRSPFQATFPRFRTTFPGFHAA